jgi:galactokinase
MNQEQKLNNIISSFHKKFGFPEIIVQSPGRINIIGEHTDYNHGLALPFAADKYIWFCAKKNGTSKMNIYAVDIDESSVVDTKNPILNSNNFDRYFASALKICNNYSLQSGGLDIAFGGNIPIGAGLSSSSSLTCGFFYLINHLFQFYLSDEDLINYSSEAENNTGVEGGKMDQTTIVKASRHKAFLLDFYYNKETIIALELDNHQFVLLHSNTHHKLADTEYNKRRSECTSILKKINSELEIKKSIRQLDRKMLEEAKKLNPVLTLDRLHFVLEENERVLYSVDMIKQNNLPALGSLMYESHSGLSQLYNVSCPELDFIVAGTKEIDNVLGARMMGGGFGGCALALIKGDYREVDFTHLQNQYSQRFNKPLDIIPVSTSDGIKII